jgi:hypothetical protein
MEAMLGNGMNAIKEKPMKTKNSKLPQGAPDSRIFSKDLRRDTKGKTTAGGSSSGPTTINLETSH